MSEKTASLLEVRALQVSIAGKVICHNLDFSLASKECLVILGRNGAGKSTLLSVLAGLRSADSGEIYLAEKLLASHAPRDTAKLRGWLGQYRPDSFASSVLETALVGRHPHLNRWDWESSNDIATARAALHAVGLDGFESRDVHTLSGGERQRLSIAAMLTQAPKVYLLDEPLTHLDLNHQIATLNLLQKVSQTENVGIIMVLHDPGLAWRYGDRALLLFEGGETELGDVDHVLNETFLSELYGYRLKQLNYDNQRWFVPA